MQRIVNQILLAGLAVMYLLPVGMAYSDDLGLADEITFTLVDASIDQDLSTLVDEATINLVKTGKELNVRADIGVPVDHVHFELDGTDFRTEKKSPYALAGDDAGDYISWTPEVGHYTLQATAYDATENEVASKIIYFTVVDDAIDADSPIRSASASDTEIVVSPSAATDWKKPVYFGDTNYIKFEFPQGRGLKNLETFELDLDVNKTAYCIMEINAHKKVNRPKIIQYAGNTKLSFESFNKSLSSFYDSFTDSISFKFQIKSNTPIAGSFAEITNASLKLVYKNNDPQPEPQPDPPPSPNPPPTPGPSPSCVEVEGKCWYYGEPYQTCREVCASHGGYDEATRTFAGSGIDGMNNSLRALKELNGNCAKVMDALGIVAGNMWNGRFYGSGCFTDDGSAYGYGTRRIRDNQATTDQDAPFYPHSRQERRVCACQN